MTMGGLCKKIVAMTLRRWANEIESDKCAMAEEEMLSFMSQVCDEPMSKEQAASYLGMHRSNFDTKIANGEIPHGRKIKGFKELRWYRSELDASVARMHRHKKKE